MFLTLLFVPQVQKTKQFFRQQAFPDSLHLMTSCLQLLHPPSFSLPQKGLHLLPKLLPLMSSLKRTSGRLGHPMDRSTVGRPTDQENSSFSTTTRNVPAAPAATSDKLPGATPSPAVPEELLKAGLIRWSGPWATENQSEATVDPRRTWWRRENPMDREIPVPLAQGKVPRRSVILQCIQGTWKSLRAPGAQLANSPMFPLWKGRTGSIRGRMQLTGRREVPQRVEKKAGGLVSVPGKERGLRRRRQRQSPTGRGWGRMLTPAQWARGVEETGRTENTEGTGTGGRLRMWAERIPEVPVAASRTPTAMGPAPARSLPSPPAPGKFPPLPRSSLTWTQHMLIYETSMGLHEDKLSLSSIDMEGLLFSCCWTAERAVTSRRPSHWLFCFSLVFHPVCLGHVALSCWSDMSVCSFHGFVCTRRIQWFLVVLFSSFGW